MTLTIIHKLESSWSRIQSIPP